MITEGAEPPAGRAQDESQTVVGSSIIARTRIPLTVPAM
jgi:hypothetical protein